MIYFFFSKNWRDVIGYEGFYRISNEGNILSLRENIYLKPKQNRKLHYVRLSKDGVRKQFCVERLLEQHFLELYPVKNKSIKDLPGEIWKDIRGFEGKYQCSNKGRVKSLPRHYWTGRDNTCLRQVKGGILAQSISNMGYLRVVLSMGREKRFCLKSVHSLVARTFYNNYDMSLVTNHIDGIKTNNCIENLELITAKENVRHAIRTGLKKVNGEDNQRSLLTNRQAKEIRLAYIAGVSRKELAIRFNVGIHVIRCVIKNHNYKDENYQYKNGKGSFI